VEWKLRGGAQTHAAKKFTFKLPDAEGNMVTMKRLTQLVHHILVNRLPIMEVWPLRRPQPLFVLVSPVALPSVLRTIEWLV
jgi:hypothetical protein